MTSEVLRFIACDISGLEVNHVTSEVLRFLSCDIRCLSVEIM